RNTTFSRDWSSDVCSSDLIPVRLRVVLRYAQGALQVDLTGADRSRLVKRHVGLPDKQVGLAEFSERRDQAEVFFAAAILDNVYEDRNSVVHDCSGLYRYCE